VLRVIRAKGMLKNTQEGAWRAPKSAGEEGAVERRKSREERPRATTRNQEPYRAVGRGATQRQKREAQSSQKEDPNKLSEATEAAGSKARQRK